jgi:hypothetical protein
LQLRGSIAAPIAAYRVAYVLRFSVRFCAKIRSRRPGQGGLVLGGLNCRKRGGRSGY